MFQAPKDIRLNRLLKNRTLNFDTAKRTDGNLVFILTDNKDSLYNTIKSELFRPQQIMRAYSPRIIRPLKRAVVKYDVSQLFGDLKDKTNGRIMYCKINPTLFGGKNFLWDVSNEYIETAKTATRIKAGIAAMSSIREYMHTELNAHMDEVGYDKAYLVFTLDAFIDDFNQTIKSAARMTTNPLMLFLKDLNDGKANYYKRFERIFIFNSASGILMSIDPNDESVEKNFGDIRMRLARLNNFVGGVDGETLDDIDDDDSTQSDEDYEEDVKEKIKNEVFKRVAKQLKAHNVNDFEETTKEDRILMMKIDKKIDSVLNSPEASQLSFNDLVNKIDTDDELKLSTIKYIENKRSRNIKAENLSKQLEKEVAALDKVSSIMSSDEENTFDKAEFQTSVRLDERIKKSALPAMDREYNSKYLKRDINNAISSFSQENFSPIAVTNIEYVDTSDDFNEKETVKVQYKTDENQALSFQLDIPKIIDDHYLYIGGNKYTIAKQLYRLPIVKTKYDRVEITTSYQKMTIERRGSKLSRRNVYLLKILKTYDNKDVKIYYGDNSLINSGFDNDFEYEELSSSISRIESKDIDVIFNRQVIQEHIESYEFDEDFITSDMTPFALGDKNDFYFIKNTEVFHAFVENHIQKIESENMNLFEFLLRKVLFVREDNLPSIGKSFIYTTVKFLTVVMPIIVLTGLMNGLQDILKRHKVNYQISEKRLALGHNWVEVKFKDKYMYYEDKIQNTLLLNALYILDTENYDFEDFEKDDPYMDYLVDKLGQPRYAKNMFQINIEKMIDPITKEILIEQHQPTNIIDLLLYANNLLINNACLPLNDMKNWRIRGNEIIAAVLYGKLSEAYKKYQQYKLNGNPTNLSINKSEVIQTLIGQPNINTTSMLNPIMELENAYALTAKGYKGVNLDKAYTLEMRSYSDSMVGFISGNSTPYSGSVGITRGLVFSPELTSVRGYVNNSNIKELNAANMLSAAELLSPFTAAQADAPRAAMQVAQTKHTVPVQVMSKQLFGSGANKEIAYMISDDFCFKAKQNGIVEEIDEANKVAILLYDDGTRDAIDLNEVLVKNSNSGFYIKQTFLIAFKQSERFKKYDVIAYNPSFFKGKGDDVDFCPATLAKIAITAGDFAFEDSTAITEKLSRKCATRITTCKAVSLDATTIIHEIKNVGDEIESGENLMTFTSSGDSISADIMQSLYAKLDASIIQDYTQESVKSKYSGDIVDIRIYYNHPFEELSPSLQQLITNYNNNIIKRRKKLEKLGVKTSSLKLQPTEMQTNKKIEGTEYDGVLINFYIEYFDEMGIGDKLSFQTALKGVVSKVMSDDESPLSTYRPENEIEAILTPTGVISRMTADIYSTLYVNKVLVELGQQIKEIWNS